MTRIMHCHKPKRILASALLAPLWVCASGAVSRAAAPQGEAAAKALAQKSLKRSEKSAPTEPSAKTTKSPEDHMRDPFSVPKAMAPGAGSTLNFAEEQQGPAPPGKKGLTIEELKLEGIVRLGSKSIAVLANPANRAYFLYENDELRNGAVTKITPDSVHFREDFRDPTGKMQSREVIQQLAPAHGEKK